MTKKWDYAELTKLAKECGGPDQLIKNIRHDGAINALKIGVPVTAVLSLTLKIIWDKYQKQVKIKAEKSAAILKENLGNELEKEDVNNEQISER